MAAAVWEHLIRDEADYERHVDYIHYNPVKHGYVDRATEWPYSSIRRYIKTGILPAAWGVGGGDEGEFGERRDSSASPMQDRRRVQKG